MKLLLVNNETRHLRALKSICEQHNAVDVTEVERLRESQPEHYDAVILSGSYRHSVLYPASYFESEIEFIRTTDKPVLGVCLGFELIAHAFGCELNRLSQKVIGAGLVTPTTEGAEIFQGTTPIQVTEAHRWSVEEVPPDLVVLATSKTGIEALRHRTRPLYGLQFHPEDFSYASDGKAVFDTILKVFKGFLDSSI